MMSFGQAIQTVFRKYAEFTGRAGRPEFWWWVLFVFLVNLVLNALWVPINRGTTVGSWLSWLWSLAILLPSLAVLVRRLRDAGYPWGHVFWLLLPFAGAIVLIVLAAQPSKDAVAAAPGMQAGTPVATTLPPAEAPPPVETPPATAPPPVEAPPAPPSGSTTPPPPPTASATPAASEPLETPAPGAPEAPPGAPGPPTAPETPPPLDPEEEPPPGSTS